jgi:hypothetical protein
MDDGQQSAFRLGIEMHACCRKDGQTSHLHESAAMTPKLCPSNFAVPSRNQVASPLLRNAQEVALPTDLENGGTRDGTTNPAITTQGALPAAVQQLVHAVKISRGFAPLRENVRKLQTGKETLE